jgi:hypothetical protein
MATAARNKDVFAPALDRFARELPRLLRSHYREWVIYHGKRRLGVFSSRAEAFGRAEQLHISPAECLVEYIVEPPDLMDRSQLEGK